MAFLCLQMVSLSVLPLQLNPVLSFVILIVLSEPGVLLPPVWSPLQF